MQCHVIHLKICDRTQLDKVMKNCNLENPHALFASRAKINIFKKKRIFCDSWSWILRLIYNYLVFIPFFVHCVSRAATSYFFLKLMDWIL